jgi:hypothetical protein
MGFYPYSNVTLPTISYNNIFIANRYFIQILSFYNQIYILPTTGTTNYNFATRQIAYDLTGYKYITIKNIGLTYDVKFLSSTPLPVRLSFMTKEIPVELFSAFSIGLHPNNLLVHPISLIDNTINLFMSSSSQPAVPYNILNEFNINTNISSVIMPNTYYSIILQTGNGYANNVTFFTDILPVITKFIKKYNLPDIARIAISYQLTIQGEII